MSQEELKAKSRVLFQKAKAARKEGKADLAKSFRAGARRVERQVKSMLKGASKAKKAS